MIFIRICTKIELNRTKSRGADSWSYTPPSFTQGLNIQKSSKSEENTTVSNRKLKRPKSQKIRNFIRVTAREPRPTLLNRVSQICVKTIPSCRAYCFRYMKKNLDSSDVSRRRYWVCMKSPKTDFLLFHDFLNWICVDNISSLTQARVLKFLPNIQFGVGNMPMLSIWHSLTTGEFSLPLSYLWMGSKSRSPSR